MVEDLLASSALAEIALNPRPGGIIMPFCEPAMVTSTPHSSCRYSSAPMPETVSTSSNAGWRAASIAARTAAISVTQPVEVSLCTTPTALMLWAVSAASAAPIASISAAWRQSVSIISALSCSFFAISIQLAANWPVRQNSTRSPGESVLTSAASHEPVPEPG